MKKTSLIIAATAFSALTVLNAEIGIVETTGLFKVNGADTYLTQTGATANPFWDTHDFGSFDVSQGDTLVFNNFFFENYAYNGTFNNWLDATSTATVRILVDNSTVGTYSLTQDTVNVNNREWSISGGISLNALDGLAVGAHSIAFEVDYTYNFWNGVSTEVQTAVNADTGSADFSISAVPEPSTYALIAGMLGFAHVAMRRRNS